jgi:hypothetical protein
MAAARSSSCNTVPHRPQVAIVHDMEEDIGGVLPVGQIFDFVNHKDVRISIGRQRLLQMSFPAGIGKILDQSRLQCEVELVDGFEEGKVRAAGEALQSCLLASRHFFGQQKRQDVAIRPTFLLGSIGHFLVGAAHVCRVQASEQQPAVNECADKTSALAAQQNTEAC